jgi:predicted DNA-binding ribbon-helix-helix protein
LPRPSSCRCPNSCRSCTEALELHGEVSNFSSLLRCCCLVYLSNSWDAYRAKREAEAARSGAGVKKRLAAGGVVAA